MAATNCLTPCATTLALAPRLAPVIPDLPFSGGLVGVRAYDLVRYFERLPNAPVHPNNPQAPEAAYLAAESLLVFDHLTRRIALLHAGSEAERLQLRARVIASAARGLAGRRRRRAADRHRPEPLA